MMGLGLAGSSVVGLPFVLITVLVVPLARWSRLHTRRTEMLIGASLGFVALVSPLPDAVCLTLMAITGLALTHLLRQRRSGALLGVGVVLVVAEFLLTRQVLPWTVLAVGPTIGLSYIMFRVIHMMVDAQTGELDGRDPARGTPAGNGTANGPTSGTASDGTGDSGPGGGTAVDGRLPGARIRDQVCFLVCYLTFLAGPVARVQDFAAELATPPRGSLRDAMADHGPAIISGLLKATILSGVTLTCFGWSQQPTTPPVTGHAAGWVSFAAYLYLTFAGYTQVVRGVGGLIGLHLPENFAQPWAAANFLDLWSRWHISLSEWFKLYVFNPLVKALIGRVERPALVPYLGAAGYFVTFFLMGLWHGISVRFALYGLVLGGAMSVNKLYQAVMLKRLGRKPLNLLIRRPWYGALARGLAVSCFVLALGFLWIPAGGEAGAAWGIGELAGWVAGATLVTAGIIALSFAAPWLHRIGKLPHGTRAICAIEALGVLAYLLLGGPVPPLIYVFF